MEKALFHVNQDTVGLTFNISKSNIDVEKRIVSGWATIDNVDQEGDQVTASASAEAFANFRGNVREMHQPIAVGSVVKFDQQTFYNEDGQEYKGIFVSVYISKGAEDTWQKVLDGTLSAFSINGPIDMKHVEKKYLQDTGNMVRVINKYKLAELSLVDSPGNELCNFVSIVKSVNGQAKLTNEIVIDNVFWCENDRTAIISKSSEHVCSVCENIMKNIGWFEELDDTDIRAEIKKILGAYTDNVTKGGPNMADTVENTKNEDVVDETTEVESAEETESVTDAPVDEEVTEVAEPDLATLEKALTEIKEALQNVSKDSEARETALADVRNAVSKVENTVEEKLGDLLNKHNDLSSEFTALKDSIGGVEKRLHAVESNTAIKKSNDVADEEDTLQKSKKNEKGFWTGSFVP